MLLLSVLGPSQKVWGSEGWADKVPPRTWKSGCLAGAKWRGAPFSWWRRDRCTRTEGPVGGAQKGSQNIISIWIVYWNCFLSLLNMWSSLPSCKHTVTNSVVYDYQSSPLKCILHFHKRALFSHNSYKLGSQDSNPFQVLKYFRRFWLLQRFHAQFPYIFTPCLPLCTVTESHVLLFGTAVQCH